MNGSLRHKLPAGFLRSEEEEDDHQASSKTTGQSWASSGSSHLQKRQNKLYNENHNTSESPSPLVDSKCMLGYLSISVFTVKSQLPSPTFVGSVFNSKHSCAARHSAGRRNRPWLVTIINLALKELDNLFQPVFLVLSQDKEPKCFLSKLRG